MYGDGGRQAHTYPDGIGLLRGAPGARQRSLGDGMEKRKRMGPMSHRTEWPSPALLRLLRFSAGRHRAGPIRRQSLFDGRLGREVRV